MHKLPITKPYFDAADLAAMAEPLQSGWVVQGPKVKQFEDLFASFVGVKHAVATTSCTSALHLGLLAAGVKPGDEVIMPSFTFVATANAVEYCGATPVFCDIDIRTFTLDVSQVERKITASTKAVIPVSLFGLLPDMDLLEDLCRKRNIILFEDAACAAGARKSGRHAGTWGIGGAFSFHPRKAITTGEGGMFTTNDSTFAETVRSLRDHGASKSDLQRHSERGGSLLPAFNALGYNYRMTDIQGALGVTQMRKLAWILEGRAAGAALYNKLLRDLPFVLTPQVPDGHTHGYQSYVVLFTDTPGKVPAFDRIEDLNRRRNLLMGELESGGISVRQGTHAVHTLGYYAAKYGISPMDYPYAYMADRLSIALPLYHDFSETDALYVHQSLADLYR